MVFAPVVCDIPGHERRGSRQVGAGDAGAEPSWVERKWAQARFDIEPTMRSRITASGLEQIARPILI